MTEIMECGNYRVRMPSLVPKENAAGNGKFPECLFTLLVAGFCSVTW